MSGCSDIKVVQKALEWYEKVMVIKINHNKSSGLQLGAVCILGVWFQTPAGQKYKQRSEHQSGFGSKGGCS